MYKKHRYIGNVEQIWEYISGEAIIHKSINAMLHLELKEEINFDISEWICISKYTDEEYAPIHKSLEVLYERCSQLNKATVTFDNSLNCDYFDGTELCIEVELGYAGSLIVLFNTLERKLKTVEFKAKLDNTAFVVPVGSNLLLKGLSLNAIERVFLKFSKYYRDTGIINYTPGD